MFTYIVNFRHLVFTARTEMNFNDSLTVGAMNLGDAVLASLQTLVYGNSGSEKAVMVVLVGRGREYQASWELPKVRMLSCDCPKCTSGDKCPTCESIRS